MKICNGIFKVDGCICKDYLDKFKKMHISIWLFQLYLILLKYSSLGFFVLFLNQIFKKSLQKCSHLKLLDVCPSMHTF